MKRKMVNIMTTMLLISNISMNTVYASPVLEPTPSLDDTMIVIHYRTTVNFSTGWYPKTFDKMKECYENENLNQKSQKYKIKDVIYLYDSNAENAKKWFEEQNKKNNIII